MAARRAPFGFIYEAEKGTYVRVATQEEWAHPPKEVFSVEGVEVFRTNTPLDDAAIAEIHKSDDLQRRAPE